MERETSETRIEREMVCNCGNNTYHIKFNEYGDLWATCTECGRPTNSVGIGFKKRQEWENAG